MEVGHAKKLPPEIGPPIMKCMCVHDGKHHVILPCLNSENNIIWFIMKFITVYTREAKAKYSFNLFNLGQPEQK